MPYGYSAKILEIDVTDRKQKTRSIDDRLYRSTMGGSCLGAVYFLENLNKNIDPLSPENILLFSTGIVTGAPVPGSAIYSVISKSPLTQRIHEAPTPGYLGEKIKKSGYDLIAIKGRSSKPVILFINGENIDFIEAEEYWGLSTGKATERIYNLLGSDVSVATIGPAGEKQVLFASIVNDFIFNTSRGGLGAVMGSKNIKAIAINGKREIEVFDKKTLEELSIRYKRHFIENPVSKGHYEGGGAAGFIEWLSNEGLLSARNAHHTSFSEAREIDGNTIVEKYGYENVYCANCYGGCKRRLKKEINGIDNRYGAPELETLASIGVGSELKDLDKVLKACELTSRYGLDGTSTGAVIAFANECYENGYITRDDTGGIELGFGNSDAAITLIELIVKREGVGDVLARGVMRASEILGKETKDFALHVKGMEISTHDPRTKAMLGLGYAVNSNGPVYTAVEHDTDFDYTAPELYMRKVSPLTVYDRLEATDLGPEKVRMFYLLQPAFSMLDAVGACIFAFSPVRYFDFRDLVKIIDAITGWETSLFELFKIGEKRLNLFRAFNMREGFTSEEDKLPDRYFKEIEKGPKKGIRLYRDEFDEARKLYYQLAGWNEKTGWPKCEKLLELDIDWVKKYK